MFVSKRHVVNVMCTLHLLQLDLVRIVLTFVKTSGQRHWLMC